MMKLDILGGHRKLDYFWGVFLNILGLFIIKVKIQYWNIFGGC